MPIQNFSNFNNENIIKIKGKRTIRLIGVSFSRGFENLEWLEFELSFLDHPEVYHLNFKNVVVNRNESALSFYRGNGAVFPIPEHAKELRVKVVPQKNMDFDIVLTYDFYPGSI
jgi:hypothetical protein